MLNIGYSPEVNLYEEKLINVANSYTCSNLPYDKLLETDDKLS